MRGCSKPADHTTGSGALECSFCVMRWFVALLNKRPGSDIESEAEGEGLATNENPLRFPKLEPFFGKDRLP